VYEGDGRRNQDGGESCRRLGRDVHGRYGEERVQRDGAAVDVIERSMLVRVRGRVFGKRRPAVTMDQRLVPALDPGLMHVLGRRQRQYADEDAQRQRDRPGTRHLRECYAATGMGRN